MTSIAPRLADPKRPSGFAPNNSRFPRPSSCFAVNSRPYSCPASAGWREDHCDDRGIERAGLRPETVFTGQYEGVRGVKEWLSRHFPPGRSYKPTLDQLPLTRMIDFARSPSVGIALVWNLGECPALHRHNPRKDQESILRHSRFASAESPPKPNRPRRRIDPARKEEEIQANRSIIPDRPNAVYIIRGPSPRAASPRGGRCRRNRRRPGCGRRGRRPASRPRRVSSGSGGVSRSRGPSR